VGRVEINSPPGLQASTASLGGARRSFRTPADREAGIFPISAWTGTKRTSPLEAGRDGPSNSRRGEFIGRSGNCSEHKRCGVAARPAGCFLENPNGFFDSTDLRSATRLRTQGAVRALLVPFPSDSAYTVGKTLVHGLIARTRPPLTGSSRRRPGPDPQPCKL